MAQAAASPKEMQKETLRFSDGETLDLPRLPELDDKTWAELKEYLASNPEVAKSLKSFASNPQAVRGFLHTKNMVEYYNKKVADGELTDKLNALKDDPELAPIFEQIMKEGDDGVEATLKYSIDEELMLKMSAKMGGLPNQLKEMVMRDAPQQAVVSLHEACKFGNMRAVQEFLGKGVPSDIKDAKGITPICYAIGGSHLEIVKVLMQSKADPHNVDAGGNSGLHYAAGYGRKELVEFLLNSGADANKKNLQGQTPLQVASRNKDAVKNNAVTMKLLKSAGGK